ncbi:MAG: hypothetical protein JWS12_889 [Candidatus Saccharibacteria bacterium]|nr:hypothetical protein [Candidatus Saccharibacteria bacterium]
MDVQRELVDKGCLFLNTGNQFIGNSGMHLTGYCNVDPLLPHIRRLQEITWMMVEPFADEGVEAVLHAAVGAIPLGTLATEQLIDTTGIDVTSVFADKKEPEGQELSRNGFFEALVGRRVLILDGMVNTQFTYQQLLGIAMEADCEVVGMTAIAANLGVNQKSLGVPKFRKLSKAYYEAWDKEDCLRNGPCAKGMPIVVDKPLGHGYAYRKKHPNQDIKYVNLLGDSAAS